MAFWESVFARIICGWLPLCGQGERDPPLEDKEAVAELLPAGVSLESKAWVFPGNPEMTVEQKLARMRAHVKGGKLFGADSGVEIKFYKRRRPVGMPTGIDENLRLTRLREKYLVVERPPNPVRVRAFDAPKK